MEETKLCIVFRVNKQTKANFSTCQWQAAAERTAFSLIRDFIWLEDQRKEKDKITLSLFPS